MILNQTKPEQYQSTLHTTQQSQHTRKPTRNTTQHNKLTYAQPQEVFVFAIPLHLPLRILTRGGRKHPEKKKESVLIRWRHKYYWWCDSCYVFNIILVVV